MAVQLIRKVRTSQPKNKPQICYGNRLARGLVFAAYPNGGSFVDAVSGLRSSANSGVNTAKQTIDGNKSISIQGAGASGAGGVFPAITGADTIAGPHSVFAEGSSNLAGSSGVMFRSNHTGTGNGMAMYFDDVNVVDGITYYCNNGVRAFSSVGALNSNSELYTHRGMYTADGTNVLFYAKGKLNRTVASTYLPTANTGRRTYMLSGSGTQGVASSSLVLIWNRVLSLDEYCQLYENPWQIFKFETIPLFYSTVTAQYARPTSDVSTGTWTASSGSDLFAMLDETTASDSDYIVTTGASTCEVALGSLSDPASSSGHVVRYRISADSGGITVRLRQGTTTIATWTHASAPTSLTTYAQTLTSGEADSITDYSALRLQFEAT